MGLYWQTKKLHDGDTASFTFPDRVQSYFAGIAGFQLSYPHYSHRLKDLGVELTSNQTSSDEISVSLALTFEDSAGYSADYDTSWVFVTVVAWTRSANLACLAEAAIDQPVRCQDQVSFAAAALNSFRMGVGQGEKILSVTAQVGARHHDDEVTGNGDAQFRNSEQTSQLARLDVGLLASLEGEQYFEIGFAQVPGRRLTHDGQDNQASLPVSFSQAPAVATALLVSFDASMAQGDPNRFIYCLKAGAMRYSGGTYAGPPDSVQISGTDVTVTSNISLYQELGFRHQSNLNRATFLVIASSDESSQVGPAPVSGLAAPPPVPRGDEMSDDYPVDKE